jgi:hypothetical protein
MKKVLLAAGIIAAIYVAWGRSDGSRGVPSPSARGDQAVADAFRERRSGVPVTGEGVVTAVLPDDRDGDRHQRFIVRLASGQSLLVAHNIDLAPRLPSLTPGDSVAFSGVYEWNARGGLVHWTHRDPSGRHRAGWLRRDGETFR